MIERMSRNFRVLALFSLLDDAQERGNLAEYSLKVNAYQVNVNIRGANDAVLSRMAGILPGGQWVSNEEYVYVWG